MRLLVFTTLYPNRRQPYHGLFVRNRVRAYAAGSNAELRIVAPVPYRPSLLDPSGWAHSEVPREEDDEGIVVLHPTYFKTPKIGMALYHRMLELSVAPTVRRLLKDFDCDVIDAHYVFPDGAAAVRLGRRFGKPVVVSARGSDVNQFQHFPVVRRILRRTLTNATRVVAVSGALKTAMVNLGVREGRISVVPNGVDSNIFFPSDKRKARTELGLDARPIVLSVGHLAPVKGFELVIEAVARLARDGRRPEISLILVGEGQHGRSLQARVQSLGAESHVRLVGAVPQAELAKWYSAADVFCLASEREGWPNVVMEALACGLPVVASRVGGLPEILTDESLGMLVDRDPDALADALARALGQSWDHEAIARRARSRSWSSCARELHQIFVETVRDFHVAGVSSTPRASD